MYYNQVKLARIKELCMEAIIESKIYNYIANIDKPSGLPVEFDHFELFFLKI